METESALIELLKSLTVQFDNASTTERINILNALIIDTTTKLVQLRGVGNGE